jgi:CPA2 family monovalent cation:H+ antiporter-2
MGLGISQLGEFSFMIAAMGLNEKVISQETFNKLLLMALGSLILTPFMLKFGLKYIQSTLNDTDATEQSKLSENGHLPHAIIIGMGPIGRLVASRLETLGVEVSLVDLSPVNLQKFAQAGFHTISGDASDPGTLSYAGAMHCQLAVISVPDDMRAIEIVLSLRKMNPQTNIVVRCRYQSNVSPLKKAGATQIISEEVEASSSILKWCEKIVASC